MYISALKLIPSKISEVVRKSWQGIDLVIVVYLLVEQVGFVFSLEINGPTNTFSTDGFLKPFSDASGL